MTEDEKAAALMDSMVVFNEQMEAHMKEMSSVEQEILLLDEQITTKDDHLRQLSAQRSGLYAKYQSIRHTKQDAVMKYMTDTIETMVGNEGKADA